MYNELINSKQVFRTKSLEIVNLLIHDITVIELIGRYEELIESYKKAMEENYLFLKV